MALEVGKTHDIVVLVNASQELGLSVKPHAYRLGRAPEFIPRIGRGAPSAGDFDHWRALIQRCFAGGEGVLESRELEGLESFARGYGVVPWPAGLGPALLPAATSMQGVTPLALSLDAPINILELSNAPFMTYKKHLYAYTNNLWVSASAGFTSNVVSAVQHSGIAFFTQKDSHMLAYGPIHDTTGGGSSRIYTPAYNTLGDQLFNYDHKLWRTEGHRIAYLTPTTGWSAYTEVGDATSDILNSEVAFGRIYFGKRDGLWCYEGGRVYEVEPFRADASDDNFSLMHASHGALYFNIQNRLYRYTGAGNIELLFTYPYEALLGPAATAQEKLYFSVQDQSHCGSLYAYDFRTRGFFREWDLQSEGVRHTVHDVVHITGLGVAANKLWIAPVDSTVNVTSVEGVAGLFPDYTTRTTGSYLIGDRVLGDTASYTSIVTMRETALKTGYVRGLRFNLRRVGTPLTDLEFALYADDGGSPGAPTGSPLVTASVAKEDVGATYGWVTGLFSSPYEVTAGTTYHIAVKLETVDKFSAASYYLYYLDSQAAGWGWDYVHEYTGTPQAWANVAAKAFYQHIPMPPSTKFFGSRISELPSRRADAPPYEHNKVHTGYVRMYTPWLNLGYPGLRKYISNIAVESVIEGIGAHLNVSMAVDGGEGVVVNGVVQQYSSGNWEDHTTNLTDEDPDTYVDFEWGTFGDQEALFSHATQEFYVCGGERFDTIAWRLREDIYHSREFTSPVGDVRLYVWTGVEWRHVMVREDTTQEGNWVLAHSGQWTIRPPRHWEERTLQNITGFWLKIVNDAPNAARENNQRLYELSLAAHAPESQGFTALDSITTVGDALTSLDIHRVAHRIALRFDLVNSKEASAFLKSFKLAFNPVGEGKREVRVVVKAWDDLKRLDGTVEHSGAYIAEAVQSLHDAGLLYVVGLPYPTPHSVRAQVQLGESILVPMLVYTAQTGKPRLIPRADIPLRIIEG